MVTLAEFTYQSLQILPGPLAARAQHYPGNIFSSGVKSPGIEATFLPHPSESRNTEKYTLRGYKMHTKQNFFDELSAVLQFPPYFGENWDACEECLNDLSWISTENIIIDFLSPEEVLLDSNADFPIFADIYQRIFLAQINQTDNKGTDHILKFLLSTRQAQNSTLLKKWSVPGVPQVYWLV